MHFDTRLRAQGSDDDRSTSPTSHETVPPATASVPMTSGAASAMLTHQDRSDTSEGPLNTSHLDTPAKALQIQVRNRVLQKRVRAGYYG